MTTVPSITTDRLVLRAHRADDFPSCAVMWADPEVVRFIGAKPRSAQDAWFAMLRYSGTWGLLGFGYWAITNRQTGTFLGEGGFGDFRRGIAQLDGVPEMGWALAPFAWGRGIATEAVTAMLAWADTHLDAAQIRCIISAENEASVRVAEKSGFTRFAHIDEPAGRSLLLRRFRRS